MFTSHVKGIYWNGNKTVVKVCELLTVKVKKKNKHHTTCRPSIRITIWIQIWLTCMNKYNSKSVDTLLTFCSNSGCKDCDSSVHGEALWKVIVVVQFHNVQCDWINWDDLLFCFWLLLISQYDLLKINYCAQRIACHNRKSDNRGQ